MSFWLCYVFGVATTSWLEIDNLPMLGVLIIVNAIIMFIFVLMIVLNKNERVKLLELVK